MAPKAKRKRGASPSAVQPTQQAVKRTTSSQRAPTEDEPSISRFKYDKLPDPALYIRLIRRTTAPSKSKGLAFELKVTHRKRAPPYIALSYCWGPADVEPQQILLQGAALPIRRNLHSALVAGCIEDDAWAWIDAICINQEDYEEKSCQVNSMRDIFSGAYKTVVWIGCDSEGKMAKLFDAARGLDFGRGKRTSVSKASSSSLRHPDSAHSTLPQHG